MRKDQGRFFRPHHPAGIKFGYLVPLALMAAGITSVIMSDKVMQMSVYKRGKYWHFTKTIDGVRYRGAFKTAHTKTQAEEAEHMARLKRRKLSKSSLMTFIFPGHRPINAHGRWMSTG